MEFNDPSSNKAIYLQIVDRICDDILRGIFPPGERLPSVRDHAAQLEVNANTMMRSYDLLQQHNLIFNRRGIGYFVAEDAPLQILNQRRKQFFDSEVRYFYERMRMFGIRPDELASRYADYCREIEQNP